MVLDEVEERHQLVDHVAGVAPDGAAAPRACASPRRRRPAGRRRRRHRHRGGGLLARPARRPAPGGAARDRPWRRRRQPRCGADAVFEARTALRLIGPRTGLRGDAHPPDVRHRLATDQPALVEQPVVLAVELLERVVRQDRRLGLLGDAQHERVAAADRAGRRGDELVVGDRGVELLDLRSSSIRCPNVASTTTVTAHAGVIGDVRVHGLVELGEARHRSTFGRDVRAVDHDVLRACGLASSCRRVIVESSRRDQRQCSGTSAA